MSSSNSAKNNSSITQIFGTADRVILKGPHVDVVDFKFGRGEIDDADINVQGQAYVLGVMDRFPHLRTATLHFVCPRRDELLTHDYKREDMETIRLRLRVIVDRATEEEPKYNPTTDACRFCKHRTHCPALGEKLLPLAKRYDDGSKAFEVMLMDKLNPDLIEDPAVLGRMKTVGFLIKSWSEAVDKQALKLAVEQGADIEGYDLLFRKTPPKIDDPEQAFSALEGMLTADEFMSACSVTVAALAKAQAAKLPRGHKKDARGQVELALMGEDLLESEDERERKPFLKRASTL